MAGLVITLTIGIGSGKAGFHRPDKTLVKEKGCVMAFYITVKR